MGEKVDVEECISVDPEMCHGKPCFKGTRIMVHLVLDLLEAGGSKEEITGDEYDPDLTEEHVKAALHYASQLLQSRVCLLIFSLMKMFRKLLFGF